jgi:hypothetical protein
MKTRTDLINAVIAATGAQSYLEIGVGHGTNYRAVEVPHKVGVDPAPYYKGDGVQVISADAFFSTNASRYDVVFVDGDHQMPAPLNDIVGSLEVSPVVLVHDACPTRVEHTKHGSLYRPGEIWMGQVWQALLYSVERLGLSLHIWPQDFGVALVTGTVLDNPDMQAAMAYDFGADFTRLLAYHCDAHTLIEAAVLATQRHKAVEALAVEPVKKTRKRKTKND